MLQCTELDSANVRSMPLLEDFISGHGDETVFFSCVVRELVPGGLAVQRIAVVTELALYKIPQTASDTGIFFNSRFPLQNLTQVLVIEDDISSCVQFNGVKPVSGENTLFTLQFLEEKKKKECLLTLCHRVPDLPILRKKRVDGAALDLPFVVGLAESAAIAAQDAPPATRAEAAAAAKTIRFAVEDGSSPPPLPPPPPPAAPVAAVPLPSSPQRSVQLPSTNQRLPCDPSFEREKAALRQKLFEHDLTSLQVRAALTLRDDYEGGDGYCKVPETQGALLGGGGDEASASCYSKPTSATELAVTWVEDGEARRRRLLALQEEERIRQQQLQEKQEVESMVGRLQSVLDRVVTQEAARQTERQRRIAVRQHRTEQRLQRLRRSKQPPLPPPSPQAPPPSSPSPASPPDLSTRFLLGAPLHDAYCLWRQCGGLLEPTNPPRWSFDDSEALAKGLGEAAERIRKRGEKMEYVTRVKAMQAAVKREAAAFRNRAQPHVLVAGKSGLPVTVPEPFQLSTGVASRVRSATNKQFRDELQDRELRFVETQQRIRRDHLSRYSKTESRVEGAVPLTAREEARQRGIGPYETVYDDGR